MIKESVSYRIFNGFREIYLHSVSLRALNQVRLAFKRGFLCSGTLRILSLPPPEGVVVFKGLRGFAGGVYARSFTSLVLGGIEGAFKKTYSKSLFYRFLVEGEEVHEEKPL
ncbi:MAG: hypothetical protein AVO33_05855 [delta proteobacterium ML8_F1]|nr:MAG: hypothetical protein AVO33_05855 [delta proteobacterium ML8_F1]